ncbi:hypothetical protein Scep_026806 [Stephania cephalantha]|uniref:Uncharacterized protein n=1 Tax=Stephania cephalantha TaxID=152367 RepID=A0AAP0HSD1_9MAGN
MARLAWAVESLSSHQMGAPLSAIPDVGFGFGVPPIDPGLPDIPASRYGHGLSLKIIWSTVAIVIIIFIIAVGLITWGVMKKKWQLEAQRATVVPI